MLMGIGKLIGCHCRSAEMRQNMIVIRPVGRFGIKKNAVAVKCHNTNIFHMNLLGLLIVFFSPPAQITINPDVQLGLYLAVSFQSDHVKIAALL